MQPNKQPVLPFPGASLEPAVPLPEKKRDMRYLWLYAIGLFAVAIVLMLLSFLGQARRTGEEALNNAKLEHEKFSVSALQSIEKMQDENAALRQKDSENQLTQNALLSQIEDLREQIDGLLETNGELRRDLEAAEHGLAAAVAERDALRQAAEEN